MDVPYLSCNYPNRRRTSCSTRKLPDRVVVGLQQYSARTFHVTLFPRIYKGGQGPPQNTSTPKAIQTITQTCASMIQSCFCLSLVILSSSSGIWLSLTSFLFHSGLQIGGPGVLAGRVSHWFSMYSHFGFQTITLLESL